jgi:regulator of RNase E activity RraA
MVVDPGDIIVGDADGMVAVPLAEPTRCSPVSATFERRNGTS